MNKTYKIFRRTILISTLALLAACASHGNKFDPAKVDLLTPGQSNIGDATALLGKPTSVSTAANGSKLLQWQYVQAVLIAGKGAHVAILFDQTEKMVRVTHRYESGSN
jgi:hypothetical protein